MPKYHLQYQHQGRGCSLGIPEAISLFLHIQVKQDFVSVEEGLKGVPHSGQGTYNAGVSNSIL